MVGVTVPPQAVPFCVVQYPARPDAHLDGTSVPGARPSWLRRFLGARGRRARRSAAWLEADAEPAPASRAKRAWAKGARMVGLYVPPDPTRLDQVCPSPAFGAHEPIQWDVPFSSFSFDRKSSDPCSRATKGNAAYFDDASIRPINAKDPGCCGCGCNGGTVDCQPLANANFCLAVVHAFSKPAAPRSEPCSGLEAPISLQRRLRRSVRFECPLDTSLG